VLVTPPDVYKSISGWIGTYRMEFMRGGNDEPADPYKFGLVNGYVF